MEPQVIIFFHHFLGIQIFQENLKIYFFVEEVFTLVAGYHYVYYHQKLQPT